MNGCRSGFLLLRIDILAGFSIVLNFPAPHPCNIPPSQKNASPNLFHALRDTLSLETGFRLNLFGSIERTNHFCKDRSQFLYDWHIFYFRHVEKLLHVQFLNISVTLCVFWFCVWTTDETIFLSWCDFFNWPLVRGASTVYITLQLHSSG